LRQSVANAGRLPRHADVFLVGVCAEYLVDGLYAAMLMVYDPRHGGYICATEADCMGQTTEPR
jgi:hypothetical protein